MSVLLRLYPRSWRVRYEAELRDLLAARPPSWRERVDLARGALDAQLHPELVPAMGGAPVRPGSEHGHNLPSAAPLVTTPFLAMLAAGLFVVASVSLAFRSGFIYGLVPANTLLAVGSIALAAAIWRISSRSLVTRLGALILASGLVSIVPSNVVLPVVIPMAVGSLVVAAGSLLDRTMPRRVAVLMGICGLLIYWAYLTALSNWFLIVPIGYSAMALGIGGASTARSVRLLLPSLLAVSLLSASSLVYAATTSPIVAHDGYQLLCKDVDQHQCVAQADRAAAHQRGAQPGSAILLIQVGPGDIRELCWRSPTDGTCEAGSFN